MEILSLDSIAGLAALVIPIYDRTRPYPPTFKLTIVLVVSLAVYYRPVSISRLKEETIFACQVTGLSRCVTRHRNRGATKMVDVKAVLTIPKLAGEVLAKRNV